MTVSALPDLGAAIKLHIADSFYVVTMVNTRIYLEWPKGPNKLIVPDAQGKFPTALLINTGRGGAGDVGLSLQDERVDLLCYGANMLTAHTLWRTVDFYLLPTDRSRQVSFTKANCRVLSIIRESGPLRLVDNTAGDWPFVSASYRFIYSGVPTA